MKQKIVKKEVLIELEDNSLTLIEEIEDDLVIVSKLQLVTPDYYDLEQADFEDFFEVHYIDRIIYKILQNGEELPRKNNSGEVIFITKGLSDGKGNITDERRLFIKKEKIPSDYDFTNFDLELPFLVTFTKRKFSEIKQNGNIVGKYDYNKEVEVKWEFWSDKFNKFESDYYDEILKKDKLTLFKVGYNYKGDALEIQDFISHSRLPRDAAINSQRLDGILNFHFLLKHQVHHANTVSKDGYMDDKHEIVLYRKEVKEAYNNYKFNNDFVVSIATNQKRMAQQLFENQHSQSIEMPLAWRMIIGLGGHSVYETDMTLHHIYGIPYIPGSALKGVVRSCIIKECFLEGLDLEDKEANKKAEKRAMNNGVFKTIFGSDDDSRFGSVRGGFTFMDAFPLSAPKIEADVMNVHYPKYYGGTEPPTDTQSPNPISFLTVGNTNTQGIPLKFGFHYGTYFNPLLSEVDIEGTRIFTQKEITTIAKVDNEWREGLLETSTVLEVVNYFFHLALTQHGIGAKTAVGYGYMKSE